MDIHEPRLINCGINEEDRRLDRVIRNNFPSIPLSLIHKSIRTGTIRVNSRKQALGYRLQKGDIIMVPPSILPEHQERSLGYSDPSGNIVQPLKKRTILMENRHLLFVNKEAGILVHGEDSLLLSVLAYLGHSPSEAASFTPGPLHRLDRNSSGIVCFGKTAPGARFFSDLLREGGIAKYYLALVDGELNGKQNWKDSVSRNRQTKKSYVSKGSNGKEALLTVQPLLSAGGKTLLFVRLYTGLTHQIRVQCSAHGYPLSGDRKYGSSVFKEGYLLHAYALQFESTGEFIDTRCIRALPSPSTRKRLQLLFGYKSTAALFQRIDTMIKG